MNQNNQNNDNERSGNFFTNILNAIINFWHNFTNLWRRQPEEQRQPELEEQHQQPPEQQQKLERQSELERQQPEEQRQPELEEQHQQPPEQQRQLGQKEKGIFFIILASHIYNNNDINNNNTLEYPKQLITDVQELLEIEKQKLSGIKQKLSEIEQNPSENINSITITEDNNKNSSHHNGTGDQQQQTVNISQELQGNLKYHDDAIKAINNFISLIENTSETPQEFDGYGTLLDVIDNLGVIKVHNDNQTNNKVNDKATKNFSSLRLFIANSKILSNVEPSTFLDIKNQSEELYKQYTQQTSELDNKMIELDNKMIELGKNTELQTLHEKTSELNEKILKLSEGTELQTLSKEKYELDVKIQVIYDEIKENDDIKKLMKDIKTLKADIDNDQDDGFNITKDETNRLYDLYLHCLNKLNKNTFDINELLSNKQCEKNKQCENQRNMDNAAFIKAMYKLAINNIPIKLDDLSKIAQIENEIYNKEDCVFEKEYDEQLALKNLQKEQLIFQTAIHKSLNPDESINDDIKIIIQILNKLHINNDIDKNHHLLLSHLKTLSSDDKTNSLNEQDLNFLINISDKIQSIINKTYIKKPFNDTKLTLEVITIIKQKLENIKNNMGQTTKNILKPTLTEDLDKINLNNKRTFSCGSGTNTKKSPKTQPHSHECHFLRV